MLNKPWSIRPAISAGEKYVSHDVWSNTTAFHRSFSTQPAVTFTHAVGWAKVTLVTCEKFVVFTPGGSSPKMDFFDSYGSWSLIWKQSINFVVQLPSGEFFLFFSFGWCKGYAGCYLRELDMGIAPEKWCQIQASDGSYAWRIIPVSN